MDQRVSIVTLGVADLSRSREFYERLGWRRALSQSEGIVFFQAGGMALALFPRHELAKDANVTPDQAGFSGIALALNVRRHEDVDAVLAEAVAAGATLVKPALEAPWGGYSGYFADPDGFSGKLPGTQRSRSRRTGASRFPVDGPPPPCSDQSACRARGCRRLSSAGQESLGSAAAPPTGVHHSCLALPPSLAHQSQVSINY